MDKSYIEYSNQHDQRKYPFCDDASMQSDNGTILPTGCIRDIFIYPLTGAGPFYVKMFAFTGYMELADASTDKVIGRADWTSNDADVPIYEIEAYGRQIGIVVFGNTINQILPETVMTFSSAATTLVSTCAIPLVQAGVRGLLCDDQLFTGALAFVGRNGIKITTKIEPGTGRNILRIDAVGEPPPPDESCDGGPTIEAIHIINEPCAAMIGSGGGGDIFITGRPGWVSEDNCPPQALPDSDGNLPSTLQDEICNPPPEPVDPPCGDASEYLVHQVNGQIRISAPSTLGGDNPFRVITEDTDGEQIDLTPFDEPGSIKGAERLLKNMYDNMPPTGQVVISVRGRLL